MKSDVYTKAVLTAIAILLAVCAVRLPVAAVRADDLEAFLQFDPDVNQIDVPGGSASLSGRVAIDTRTAICLRVPTNGLAYPRNLQNNNLAVSKPISLGRFDLSNLRRR